MRSGTVTLAMMLFAGALAALPALGQERKKPDLAKITAAYLASPHADRTAEAFRHWDGEENRAVPGECATCHTSRGIIDYLGADLRALNVVEAPQPLGSTVDCVSCHNPRSMALESVVFPSGARLDGLGHEAICSTCHQGRAAGADVDKAVAGREDDAVAGDLAFINIHYKAAAATQAGSTAAGGYQYPGKTYAGRFDHVKDAPATCLSCHNQHSLKPAAVATCTECHKGAAQYADIRSTKLDTDGDGDTHEGIAAEIAALHARLGEAIGAYGRDVAGVPIVYDAHAFPYFFADTNGDGLAGKDEAIFPNRYQSWTPRLLRAAYNYQFVAKDGAAYIHNPHYAIQLLHDSLQSLGGKVAVDLTGLARP